MAVNYNPKDYLKRADIPELKALDDFEGARESVVPQERLEVVRERARSFHDRFRKGPKASFYKAVTLVNVPYPMRYGFFGVYTQSMLNTPLVHITNRLYIIQTKTNAGVKTILFSPSDIMANAETRFFKRVGGGFLNKLEGDVFGPVKDAAQKLVAPIVNTVEGWLEDLNIRPEEIDYISYDHLHTQDLRNWLGTNGKPGYFPNAKLLVMRQEWESALGLLPPQQDWYCPNGTGGLDPSRVVLLEEDVEIGEGVALIRTPGHTMGNHSLVVNTDKGVLVTSENGISADSYSPQYSAIPEVRDYAENTRMEVILNGNTQESGLEQYISMVQEKEMAGPNSENPHFYNVFPSSQFSSYWMFPGIKPTFSFPDLEFGKYLKG